MDSCQDQDHGAISYFSKNLPPDGGLEQSCDENTSSSDIPNFGFPHRYPPECAPGYGVADDKKVFYHRGVQLKSSSNRADQVSLFYASPSTAPFRKSMYMER